MAVTTTSTPVFILYDEDDSTQESSRVAMQLRTYLSQQGIACNFGSYTYTPTSSANLPQHIILIYSSRSQKPASLTTEIDKVLDLVVERQVRSIVAITTPSGSLPARWASIPTYNANDYPDKNQLAEAVFREAQHAKLPYSQEEAQRALISRPAIRQPATMASFATSALIIFLCLAVLVIGGLGALIFVRPTLPISPSSANLTATAVVVTKELATQSTVASNATPTSTVELQARQKELDTIRNTTPLINGFQRKDKWDGEVTATKSCAYDDSNSQPNYITDISTSSQYQFCLANSLTYKNFALQVKMAIQSGDAGGIIFRSSDAGYYRLAINITGSDIPAVTLFSCDNGQCAKKGISDGTLLGQANANVDKQQPITLTVIARDKDIDVYANGSFVQRFTEKNPAGAGKIGVYAADISTETNITFSDLKIWSFDK